MTANDNRFLYACGSFLFSLVIVAVITFIPMQKQLMEIISAVIVVTFFLAGFIFPNFGKNLTKFAVGYASNGPDGGADAAHLASVLAKDEQDQVVYNVRPKIGVLIIFFIIVFGLIVWRFPYLF